MPRNYKKQILLPTALAVYALVMATIGYPHYQRSGNTTEFWLTLGGCLLSALLLHFVLKRRGKNRDRFK